MISRLLFFAVLFGTAVTIPQDVTPQPASTSATRTVLVTGSTDGLGREVALRLTDSGMHVIVHGRNRERGDAVVREIVARGKGSAKFFAADFSSLNEVRAFADSILRAYEKLDVLVNNAGVWKPGGTRETSRDGHEMHFAVNYLAGFLLTEKLLPLLEQGTAPRIVNVSSAAQTPIDFDDVMLAQRYDGSRAYGQSKLAQVLYTVDLAERLANRNITVVALHPATLMNTTMVAQSGMPVRSTVDEGARALVTAIVSPGVSSGSYYNGLREARANAQAYDAVARRKLREVSEQLTRR